MNFIYIGGDGLFNILIIDFDSGFADDLAKSMAGSINGVKVFVGSKQNDVDTLLRRLDFRLVIINALLKVDDNVTAFGFTLADKMRHYDKFKYTDIIMYSKNYMDNPIRLRQLHIMDFFEVPFDMDEFIRTVRFVVGRYMTTLVREEKMYYLKSGDLLYQFPESDIRCIEYQKRKCVLHMSGRDIECTRSEIKEIINDLDTDIFIECGRGDIICTRNVEYYDFVEMKVVLRDNGYTPRITRSGKEKIYKKICEEKENVNNFRRLFDNKK